MARRNPITPWIPAILWILVIFSLGSGSFQHDQTSRFIGPLLRWLFPDSDIGTLHGIIRKLAHVTEYGIAAVLVYRAFGLGAVAASWRQLAIPTLAIVAAVAALDEKRQTGIAGRTGSVQDVLFDLAGGALGLAVAPWIVRRPRQTLGEEEEHG